MFLNLHPSGMTVLDLPPLVAARLDVIGLRAKLLYTDVRGGNFSRKSTTPDELVGNFAAAAYNLSVAGFALPLKAEPAEVINAPYRGIGTGGVDSDNPNAISLGMHATVQELLADRVALGLAYADAQQDMFIDTATGNVATAAGHWPHQKHQPFVHAVNALRTLNPNLRLENVFVFGTATARFDFPLNQQGYDRVTAIDPVAGALCLDEVNPTADRPYDFDLGRFTKAQIIAAGVPAQNIFWDTTNTVTSAWLPSKRRDDKAEIPYRSGLFAIKLMMS